MTSVADEMDKETSVTDQDFGQYQIISDQTTARRNIWQIKNRKKKKFWQNKTVKEDEI